MSEPTTETTAGSVSDLPDILQTGRCRSENVIGLFDRLDPVDLPFMTGLWKGREITAGHPQDGILEAARWYGKEFENPDSVHPLLHEDRHGRLFRVRPRPWLVWLSLQMPVLKSPLLRPLTRMTVSLLRTRRSQARLRMMEYRGVVTATMIYDHLPIHDHFRRVNDQTVLGLMDQKGIGMPFPFLLQKIAPEHSPVPERPDP